MATLGASRNEEARWAVGLAGLFALVALGAMAQGIAEFLLPLVTGASPFQLTRALAEDLGAAALFGAILFHNLGLALVLPGCGVLAARWEREDAKRRWIAPILIVAVAAAVAIGVVTVLATASPADASFTLALAAGEGMAVLTVGLATHRELKRFRFRRPDGEGMALAFRALAPTLVVSGLGLAALALLETRHLLGM